MINGHARPIDATLGKSKSARWSSSPNRYVLFARNFFREPRALGSFLPSSRFLVRRTLDQVAWERTRVIVEYGPGVGHFTEGILSRMRSDAVLVGIETNRDFVRYLRASIPDPRLKVMEGSALQVRTALQQAGLERADCVVSGIPFSTMPENVRRSVVMETHAVLNEGHPLLVYQISSAIRPCLESIFRTVHTHFEPLNLLPARVFHCVK